MIIQNREARDEIWY